MAFLPLLAQAVPYIAAAGAAYQGAKQSQASDYNAQVMTQEQRTSVDQANAQEGLVRRGSREALGRQAAAFGAAGAGYGGSSENALDASAVNQELDALNTRYKGAITGWGYGAQARLDRQNANQEGVGAALLAGGAYLNQMRKTPTYGGNQSPAEMAGIVTPGSN